MSVTGRVQSAPLRGGVVSEVNDGVESEIAARAAAPSPDEPARIERVAADLRGTAIAGVARDVRDVGVARVIGRISQVVDYLFFVVYGLLGLRFVLALIAARSTAGFTQFIAMVTDPLYAPFRGIVSNTNLGHGYVVVASVVVALVVYGMAHVAVRGLLRIVAHRNATVST